MNMQLSRGAAPIAPSVPSLPSFYNPPSVLPRSGDAWANVMDKSLNDSKARRDGADFELDQNLVNEIMLCCAEPGTDSRLAKAISSANNSQQPQPLPRALHDLIPPTVPYGYSPVHVACLARNTLALSTLLSNNFPSTSLDVHGNTPIMSSCISSDAECIRMLLVSPSTQKLSSVGHIKASLLQKNFSGYNTLHLLVMNSAAGSRADSATSSSSRLTSTLRTLHSLAVHTSLKPELYVDCPCPTPSKPYYSYTPLILSTVLRSLPCVEGLVNVFSASLESRDVNGLTALSHSLILGYVEISKFLISAGAVIHSPADRGVNSISHMLSGGGGGHNNIIVVPRSEETHHILLSQLLSSTPIHQQLSIRCAYLPPSNNYIAKECISLVSLLSCSSSLVSLLSDRVNYVLSNADYEVKIVDVLLGAEFNNLSPLIASSATNALESAKFLLSTSFLQNTVIEYLNERAKEEALMNVLESAGGNMISR